MSLRPSRVALAAWLMLMLTLLPGLAFATCGAEGCPCVRRGLSDNAGRFMFDVRVLDVRQDELVLGNAPISLPDAMASSGAHHHIPLRTWTRAWSLESAMRVSDRLRLSLNVPYVEREHVRYDNHTATYDPALVQSWRFHGIGDAVLQAQFRVGALEGGPRATVQAGVKLPTGRRQVERTTGIFPATLQPTLRPGSGSTDLLAGLSLSQALPWAPVLPLSLNVLHRWNGRGTDDYRAGDETQVSLSSGWAVRPWLTLTGLVNASAHASDSWTGPTASDPYREPSHAGARALFLTPGVSASVAPGMTVYALLQNRVWGHCDQPMVVARHYLLVGSSVSFGD